MNQGAKLVDEALESGKLFELEGWKHLEPALEEGTLHLIGLLTDGGVHSRYDQLKLLFDGVCKPMSPRRVPATLGPPLCSCLQSALRPSMVPACALHPPDESLHARTHLFFRACMHAHRARSMHGLSGPPWLRNNVQVTGLLMAVCTNAGRRRSAARSAYGCTRSRTAATRRTAPRSAS